MRVPSHIQNKNIPRNRIIRRSTKTGNLREALTISRQWWLSLMNDDFFEETYPALAEFERADIENDRKIKIGLSIIKEMKNLGIDEDDRLSFDSYFEGGKCLECYHLAKDYKKAIKKVKSLDNKPNIPVPAPQATPVVAQPPIQSSNTVEPSDLRLRDVMDKWVDFNMLKSKGKRWSEATKKSYLPIVKLMVELVGNPLAHEFNEVMLRDKFVSKVTLLPMRLSNSRDFKDENGNRLPLEECFEIAEENDLERISDKTIEKYATQVGIFVRWAGKHKYIARDIAVVLELLQDLAEDDPRRKYFNEEELKALFETDEYRDGLLFYKPVWHWSLLIMLYTGCRLGEACQFYIDDIFETDEKYSDGSKVWVFNFTNKGAGQKVKKQKPNFSSLVPIHPDLIKLGFLNYYQERKSKSEKQVFDVLQKNWGGTTSVWFNGEFTKKDVYNTGYAEKCGVFTDVHEQTYKENKELYSSDDRLITTRSFRHYIANRSKQELDWKYSVWCEITHHSDGEKKKTVRGEVYEDDYNLDLKVTEIEKLTFDFLDIDGIKKWE